MEMKAELAGRQVASGLRFPEGPIWLSDGSLLVVEIEAGTLTRITPSGRRDVVAKLAGGPNGAAIGPDGACYVCNNGGFRWLDTGDYLRPVGIADDYVTGRIERVDLATGRVQTLYTACDERPLNGPNDIVFDAQGGFWFSDLGKVRPHSIDRGAVFYARCDGTMIREAIFPSMMPNGVGLSPDGKTLFVAETETSRLWAYEITAPGEVRMEPWPSPNGGRLVIGSGGYQRFDSLAVEACGNICVATLVNGGITVVSPAGELLEFHPAPEGFCTNICFGGDGLRTAFITLSGTGRVIAVPWPRAGLALHAGPG